MRTPHNIKMVGTWADVGRIGSRACGKRTIRILVRSWMRENPDQSYYLKLCDHCGRSSIRFRDKSRKENIYADIDLLRIGYEY